MNFTRPGPTISIFEDPNRLWGHDEDHSDYDGEHYPLSGETDWEDLEAMTDEEIALAAASDRPMFAKAGSSGGRWSRSPKTAPEVWLSPNTDPDEAVETILSLLSREHFQTARRLAAEALARFPDHRRVANAWRIFEARDKAVLKPASEPSRRNEMAWLRNPPKSARGKWVALVGSEMVASADTLPELAKILGSKSFPKPALVHQVEVDEYPSF